jgi:hypothetical protein
MRSPRSEASIGEVVAPGDSKCAHYRLRIRQVRAQSPPVGREGFRSDPEASSALRKSLPQESKLPQREIRLLLRLRGFGSCSASLRSEKGEADFSLQKLRGGVAETRDSLRKLQKRQKELHRACWEFRRGVRNIPFPPEERVRRSGACGRRPAASALHVNALSSRAKNHPRRAVRAAAPSTARHIPRAWTRRRC